MKIRRRSADGAIVNQCWNTIGVRGDRSCPVASIVTAATGRISAGRRRLERARRLSRRADSYSRNRCVSRPDGSVVIFRVASSGSRCRLRRSLKSPTGPFIRCPPAEQDCARSEQHARELLVCVSIGRRQRGRAPRAGDLHHKVPQLLVVRRGRARSVRWTRSTACTLWRSGLETGAGAVAATVAYSTALLVGTHSIACSTTSSDYTLRRAWHDPAESEPLLDARPVPRGGQTQTSC